MSLRSILTLVDVENVMADDEGEIFDVGTLQEFVAELVGTMDSAGALNVTIEDSFDGGTTWHDWIDFTQLTATGKEAKAPTRPPGGDVKAVYDLTGGTWDVRVKLSGIPVS